MPAPHEPCRSLYMTLHDIIYTELILLHHNNYFNSRDFGKFECLLGTRG